MARDVQLLPGSASSSHEGIASPFGLNVKELRGIISIRTVGPKSVGQVAGLRAGDEIRGFGPSAQPPTDVHQLRLYLRKCRAEVVPVFLHVVTPSRAVAGPSTSPRNAAAAKKVVRDRVQDRRIAATKDELEAAQKVDRDRARDRRMAATKDELEAAQKATRERERVRRAAATKDEKEAAKKVDRDRVRDRRAAATQDELEAAQKATRERERVRRAAATKDEKEAAKKVDRDRVRDRRAAATQDELEAAQKATRERERVRRAAATKDELEAAQKDALLRMRGHRASLTPSQAEMDLQRRQTAREKASQDKRDAESAKKREKRSNQSSARAVATAQLPQNLLLPVLPQAPYAAFDAAVVGLASRESGPLQPLLFTQPRQDFDYDAQVVKELMFADGEAQHHADLLHAGSEVHAMMIGRIVDQLGESLEGRAGISDVELLPVVPFAIDLALPNLPASNAQRPTIAVVNIVSGNSGHFVALATRPDQPDIVHLFDSLQGYTFSALHPNFQEHLGMVGAAMHRRPSTAGLRFRIYGVQEQGAYNSCGAYAVLAAAALVLGVPIAQLDLKGNEVAMRRRLHDFSFCPCNDNKPHFPSLLQALSDAGGGQLGVGGDGGAQPQRCAICNQLPLHEAADPIARSLFHMSISSSGSEDDWPSLPAPKAQKTTPKPPEKRQRPSINSKPAPAIDAATTLTLQSSDTSQPHRPHLPPAHMNPQKKGGKEVKAIKRVRDEFSPTEPEPESKRVDRRKKRPVTLGSDEAKLLQRPGVSAAEASCCPHCGARLFAQEAGSATAVTSMWCCGQGTVTVPSLIPYDSEFYKQGPNGHIDAQFKKGARKLNNMFSLAATGVTGKFVDIVGGTSLVKIHGKIYHRLHDLSWVSAQGPRTNQLCILDPEFREKHGSGLHLTLQLIEKVFTYLSRQSSLFSQYRRLAAEPSDKARLLFQTTTRRTHGTVLGDAPGTGEKRQAETTADEVAAIVLTGEDAQPHQTMIWKAGEAKSSRLHYLDPTYEALSYPVMRPHAEASWHPGMRSSSGRKITHLLYQRSLHLTDSCYRDLGRLGQEATVSAFARIEQERLGWIGHNQAQLRIGTREDIASMMGEEQEGPLAGRRTVLPATFVGGDRFYRKNYHDSMAIVVRHGKADFFVTFTCNPNWVEIVPPGDPALCARVFKIKLGMLLKDLSQGALFGIKAIYVIYVIEWQKRGLPHAHILVKLERAPTMQELDDFISAFIPPDDCPEDQALCCQLHLHGPCGKHNPRSPCMDPVTKTCLRGPFPKALNKATYIDERGFPHYKRPGGTRVKIKRGKTEYWVDDGWVVPYNRFLMRKYKAHINIEWASSAHTVKYLHKYLMKGGDRARTMVAEEGAEVNEVTDYETRRYLGTSEAYWRIFSFDIHGKTIAVEALHVHLPDRDQVVFNPADPQAALDSHTSKLEQYFSRPDDARMNDLTFQVYHERFMVFSSEVDESVAHPDGVHWIRQRMRGKCIARLHWVPNGLTELYYLRLILGRFPVRSFEDVRTVNAIVHSTFQAAARALGLATDEREFYEAIDEAAGFMTGQGLRHLFITLIMGQQSCPASDIWSKRADILAEDFLHRNPRNKAAAHNLALLDLSHMLQRHGRSLVDEGLPEAKDTTTEVGRELLRWDATEQRDFVERWRPLLSYEQREVVNELLRQVCSAYTVPWPLRRGSKLPTHEFTIAALRRARASMESSRREGYKARYYFLDAPGGTGKTVVLNFVVAYLREHRHVVLCVGSTGIAALNFPGGTTAHAMFRLPFDSFDSDAVCTLSMRSQRAEMIRRATAIVWDEAANQHRNHFHAFRRLLDDVKPTALRFVVLCGDFRQIPPVIKHGEKNDILRASLKLDPIWTNLTKLHMTENQRAAADPEYAAMAMAIGNGTAATVFLPGCPLPLTPLPLIEAVKTVEELIAHAYPNLTDPYESIQNGILAGLNERIDFFNGLIMQRLPGELHSLLSADSCEDDTGEKMELSAETLGRLTDVGVPPHELQIKVGSICMITRNLNFAAGLCNSTKVIVREILPARRIVMVEIPAAGAQQPATPVLHAIPRITFLFQPGGRGMNIRRTQFPLRPCYAMTYNKAQGQTLTRASVDLTTEPFAHGHLYVTVTRVRHRAAIKAMADPSRVVGGVLHAFNLFYPELLDAQPRPPQAAAANAPAPPRPSSPELPGPAEAESDASDEL